MLKKIFTLEALRGKRTYIVASVMAMLTFLKLAGILDDQQYLSIVGFLTSVGLITSAQHKNSTDQ